MCVRERERDVCVNAICMLHVCSVGALQTLQNVAEHLLPPRDGGAAMERFTSVQGDRNLLAVSQNVDVGSGTARDWERASER